MHKIQYHISGEVTIGKFWAFSTQFPNSRLRFLRIHILLCVNGHILAYRMCRYCKLKQFPLVPTAEGMHILVPARAAR